MSLLDKLFGDPNAKEMKRYEPLVAEIANLEAQVKKLTDAQLKDSYKELQNETIAEIEKKTKGKR